MEPVTAAILAVAAGIFGVGKLFCNDDEYVSTDSSQEPVDYSQDDSDWNTGGPGSAF